MSLLVLATVLVGVLGVVSAFMTLFSFLFFSAGETNPATNLIVASIVTCSFVCIWAIIRSWDLFHAGDLERVPFVILSPLVNLVVFALGNVWLYKAYEGRFTK